MHDYINCSRTNYDFNGLQAANKDLTSYILKCKNDYYTDENDFYFLLILMQIEEQLFEMRNPFIF